MQAEGQSEEAVALDGTDPESQRQSAQRAKSIPTALSRIQPSPVTGDAVSRAREWLERVPVWQAKAAARLAFLCQMATRPPSITELHAAHREAAAQWDALAGRVPRRIWGAAHTAVYSFAYGTLAVAFSPAGFLLAVAFILTCWFWL